MTSLDKNKIDYSLMKVLLNQNIENLQVALKMYEKEKIPKDTEIIIKNLIDMTVQARGFFKWLLIIKVRWG